MEEQQNYTIAEDFTLPSRGLIYDTKINQTVKLRSMTARDEMKRLNPTSTHYKNLADIIESCLIEKQAISVYDMALGDFEFLLHRLRVVTYGSDYSITVGCPHCGATIDTVANLDDLTVKDFDEEKFNKLKTFTLPVSKRTISIKFQTPRMLDANESKVKELKRKFKDSEIDFNTLVTLTAIIDTIDGEHYDERKIESFIDSLPAKDMVKILNNIDALNACVGVNTELTVNCKECGGDILTFFRFGPEFFRPTNI